MLPVRAKATPDANRGVVPAAIASNVFIDLPPRIDEPFKPVKASEVIPVALTTSPADGAG
jgi:hypothetical protein